MHSCLGCRCVEYPAEQLGWLQLTPAVEPNHHRSNRQSSRSMPQPRATSWRALRSWRCLSSIFPADPLEILGVPITFNHFIYHSLLISFIFSVHIIPYLSISFLLHIVVLLPQTVQVWVANYAKIFEVWPRTEPSLVKRFVVDTLERSLKEPVRIRPRSHGAAENSRNVLFNTVQYCAIYIIYIVQHCSRFIYVQFCSWSCWFISYHLMLISYDYCCSSVSFVQDHASHGCVRSWPQEVSQRSIVSMSIPVATDHARRNLQLLSRVGKKSKIWEKSIEKGWKENARRWVVPFNIFPHISTYFHIFPHISTYFHIITYVNMIARCLEMLRAHRFNGSSWGCDHRSRAEMGWARKCQEWGGSSSMLIRLKLNELHNHSSCNTM